MLCLRRALLLSAIAIAAPAHAAERAVSEADLKAHIAVLASDAFEGREPGTVGETRTLAYIVDQWSRAGLVSGTTGPIPWLQPVPLIESSSMTSAATFHVGGKRIELTDADAVLIGRTADTTLTALPVSFVGYGIDAHGAVNGDVAGRAVLVLVDQPPFAKSGSGFRSRARMLIDAGARAVIGIPTDAMPWAAMVRGAKSPTTRLADPADAAAAGALNGLISLNAVDRVLTAAGQNRAALMEAAAAPGFAPVALGATADLSAQTDVHLYESHNVIAKLPGRNPDGKAVVILGHWDHLGLCRPAGAEDRVCNGAVDNASGIAVMIEVAKRLAAGPRPDRDVYFLATTAEEKGLLGAHWFAANAPVPLGAITIALNIDTIAISPRGAPLAIIGRGRADVDAAINGVAKRLGRKLDTDGEADAFIQRQDGWALGAKGVLAVMAGGSFSAMSDLQAFLASDYHSPADQLTDRVPLGGAADDADLHLALARYFASTKAWKGARPVPDAGTSAH